MTAVLRNLLLELHLSLLHHVGSKQPTCDNEEYNPRINRHRFLVAMMSWFKTERRRIWCETSLTIPTSIIVTGFIKEISKAGLSVVTNNKLIQLVVVAISNRSPIHNGVVLLPLRKRSLQIGLSDECTHDQSNCGDSFSHHGVNIRCGAQGPTSLYYVNLTRMGYPDQPGPFRQALQSWSQTRLPCFLYL